MRQILVLGGGAAGLAAALAAAQTGAGAVQVTVAERNPRPGKKLLATGNGRCNLDNLSIGPERYFTADPAALQRLLQAVDAADPLGWFHRLGLMTRADETGRVYPYSNQAADLVNLLERQLERWQVQLLTGCTVRTLAQSRGGYAVQLDTEQGPRTLHADAVICAMGGAAGPQFGTDGFGVRFAQQCGGRVEPVYPCLTALQTATPAKSWPASGPKPPPACWTAVACWPGRRAKSSLRTTASPASASCSCPDCWLPSGGRSIPPVELDLFPSISGPELARQMATVCPACRGIHRRISGWGFCTPSWAGCLWQQARLPDKLPAPSDPAWQTLAHTAKHWRFEAVTPCGWKQAQTTGGGLALAELEPESFAFRGCPGLYFVGETLDCAGTCGGFNLHWAFGSGLVAGRHAARGAARPKPRRKR